MKIYMKGLLYNLPPVVCVLLCTQLTAAVLCQYTGTRWLDTIFMPTIACAVTKKLHVINVMNNSAK